jgi:hypothetical protein
MLSVVLAAVLGASPSPSPSPLPFPEILHTITSPGCDTLHHVTLPVGYVTRVNDQGFRAMAFSTQKFMSFFMPGDVPTAADIQAALGNSNGANPQLNGTGSAMSTEMSSSSGDDPILYSPKQTIMAANIDRVAEQIIGNLALEKKYVDDSLKQYPPGTDPQVDALRAHAQNVMALQEALAGRYEQFAGEYIDNMGVADMTRGSQADLATLKEALRALLVGQGGALQGAQAESSSDPNYGYPSIQDLAKQGSTGQIVSALRDQEFGFSSALFNAFNECHGTHYVVNPVTGSPVPAPAASPK